MAIIKEDKIKMHGALYHVVTKCILKENEIPLLYETNITTLDKKYDGYKERYVCINKARQQHDAIILNINNREYISAVMPIVPSTGIHQEY